MALAWRAEAASPRSRTERKSKGAFPPVDEPDRYRLSWTAARYLRQRGRKRRDVRSSSDC